MNSPNGPFGLADVGQDLALDDDLGARRHLKIADPAARHPVRFAEQAADDLELPHLRRIGVDHRAHIVQRMRSDGDRRRQRFSLLFGAPLELIHAAARMQRKAEAVLALEHQPVKAGGVDAGDRVARRNLAGRDVGAAVDRELQRDRQLRQVDVFALDDDVMPGRIGDDFAGDVFLAALAERRRQVLRLDAEARRQQLAVAGHIGDDRHAVGGRVLENDDGALSRSFQLERDRGHVEPRVHRLANSQELLGVIRFHHLEEAAQALIVVVRGARHEIPDVLVRPIIVCPLRETQARPIHDPVRQDLSA